MESNEDSASALVSLLPGSISSDAALFDTHIEIRVILETWVKLKGMMLH